MDRILSLRNLDSNTSLSSEAGYETANDDSISSLYYSVNNDTLIDDIVSSPTVHESTIVSDQLLSYVTNVNGEGGSNGLATESTTQTSFEQDIPVSSASAVPPRNLSQAVRRATGRGQENDPRRRHVMTRRTVVTQITDIARRSVMPLSLRSQVVTNGLTENQPRPGPKPAESHICNICKKSFLLRSTLLVHGKSHNMQCQYCRKEFKKELALSIHLRDNCDKIPLAIRRNILAKEFKSLSSGK